MDAQRRSSFCDTPTQLNGGHNERKIAQHFSEKGRQGPWFYDDVTVTFQSLLIGEGDNPQSDFWLPKRKAVSPQ
jgi:hypothetical protein